MTILYKPVKIESAEQAEALPIGTVVVDQTRQVVEVKGDYGWTDEYPHYGTRDADLIGWAALVPIEAEECHSEDYGSYHLMEAVDGTKPFTAYLVDQEEA